MQSLHQVDMKNIFKGCKDLFVYFNTLETYREWPPTAYYWLCKEIFSCPPHFSDFQEKKNHFFFSTSQNYIPSTVETQINFELLLLFGRLGRQRSTENFCNLAKVFYFGGSFFSYFLRAKWIQNFSFCSVCTKKLKVRFGHKVYLLSWAKTG